MLAKHHAQGAFDIGHYKEFSSETDPHGDQALEMCGWIAMPGEQLWSVD